MAINVLLKRSTTASKRPTAAQLDIGELSLNYDANTAGVFFEDSAGNVRKVGPAEVSATAPNASPAGSSGNSLGELWYDTITSSLKVWTGSSFVAATGAGAAGGSNTQVQFNSTGTLSGSSNFTFDGTTASMAGLAVTGSSIFRAAATQDGVAIVGRAGGTSSYEVTFTPTTLTADRIQTLQDAAGTVALSANDLSFFAATTSAQLAGVISDETGSGALVFATSPTLVTPVLGVASATSVNKVAITTPATSATLTIADGKTLTASNTLTFTGTDASSVAFGTGGTVAYTANKLSVFAATTSAELAGVISDETGSGALVFATSPTLVTPILGTPSSGNLSNCTNVPAGQLSGTIPSGVLGASSLFIGTTSIALNRATAAQSLTGITSIDGSAATLTTTRTLWGQNFNGSANVTGSLTSVGDITGTAAVTLSSAAASALNLTAGTTGAAALDSGPTGAINSGTNANAKTITVGNATGATSIVLTCGTGALNIGSNAIARTITVGNNTGASALNLLAGSGNVNITGAVLPSVDNTHNLGSASFRWANVYTGDLHLKNDRGDYTIIEEEDALTLRNNKTGKVYNFVLQERV